MKILRRYKNKALIIQYEKKCDQQRIFVHNLRGSTEQHRRKYNRCMLWLQYKALDQDFTVAKLEGLWWYDDQKYAGLSIATSSVQVPRSEWEYRLLIRLPDYVDAGAVSNAAALVCAKKNIALASNVTFFELTEGKCVQMMHAGPFNTEPETLAQIGAFTQQHSFQKNGLHHEIYLSDFRNTAPEKLKTILREPVR